ncbi:MAG: deoxyribose-phosphate aldolase [Bacteroidales bacterium]|nr:deoxyribose-phosphate aldolase [Bacteroidales bacterium]
MAEYDKYKELFKIYDCCKMTDAAAKKESKKIIDENFDKNNNNEALKSVFACIDLTSLNNTDTDESAAKLAGKVADFDKKYPELPNVAAICVYPSCVAAVKDTLGENPSVEIASVAAGFPAPQTFLEVKIAETAMAVLEGATEIDMVFPLHYFLAKQYDKVEEEIMEVKSACRGAHLKVILETCALKSAAQIAEAAILAMACGADFIKTSTGKSTAGATPEGVYAMCQAVKEFNEENNTRIGIKVAGGVSETDDAVKYYTLVTETLGKQYAKKGTFRIGASRLANNVLEKITGTEEKYF